MRYYLVLFSLPCVFLQNTGGFHASANHRHSTAICFHRVSYEKETPNFDFTSLAVGTSLLQPLAIPSPTLLVIDLPS